MDGARYLADQVRQRPGRYCVIGEPTGLIPIRQHKGIFMESIYTHGQAGHSSNPAYGHNAIQAMHAVMAALNTLKAQWASKQDTAFSVPITTMNLGAIHGGDNANRIPALCRLDIDCRFLPGQDIGTLREQIHVTVNAALQDSGCHASFAPLFAGTPAFLTPASSEIILTTQKLTGYKAQAVNFGTEGAFYNKMGMESVILGPGDIAQAHQPDEFLALERIEPMLKLLHGLIQRFCAPDS